MSPSSRCRFLAVLLALLVIAPVAGAQQMEFSRCIDSLRAELAAHPEIRPETFATHALRATDLRQAIDSASRNQPEFELPIWDYLGRLVDARRISDARAVLEREAQSLARITARSGVDAATLVAVLGVESDFGRVQGRHKVVDATLSRACLRLSSQERKAHFFAALKLLQAGLVDADNFRGSWAGAFGMTRFMPATFIRHLTDGDGDGVIDTVNAMADALATTASFLSHLGWVPGMPWGIEVLAPEEVLRQMSSAGIEHACLGRSEVDGRCRALARWAGLGVTRADGSALLDGLRDEGNFSRATAAALLVPAGVQGPAWLVTRNFHAIWRYNRADSYALAIGQLASALRGEAPIRQPWPVGSAGLLLSRSDLPALQGLLRDSGHCGLEVDGFDGPMTRQAIRDEERRRGLPETGRPTTNLLEKLRADPPAAAAECPPPPQPGRKSSAGSTP